MTNIINYNDYLPISLGDFYMTFLYIYYDEYVYIYLIEKFILLYYSCNFNQGR